MHFCGAALTDLIITLYGSLLLHWKCVTPVILGFAEASGSPPARWKTLSTPTYIVACHILYHLTAVK